MRLSRYPTLLCVCLRHVCIVGVAAAALDAQSPPARPQLPTSQRRAYEVLQAMRVTNAPSIAPFVNALLADTAGHLESAPRSIATTADSARANGIVRVMRATLAQYSDTTSAVRDGYVKFLPWLDDQAIFHYNNIQHAAAAIVRIDLTRPTSLLYQKGHGGALRLIGAMYTAPDNESPEELDARLPLGVAHWHRHINFCSPRPDSLARSTGGLDSAAVGRWLAIETRDACTTAGGVFLSQLFGWMVHVNAFAGDTPEAIWGGSGKGHMHVHTPKTSLRADRS